MKKQLIALMCATALASFAGAASAETVYKCGANYSQSPCEGATTLETDTSRRDAVAAKEARDRVQRQAKLANDMEKARLKEEAKPVKYYIAPTKSANADDGPKKKIEMTKPGKVQYFTAVSSGESGDAKKKKGKKKD